MVSSNTLVALVWVTKLVRPGVVEALLYNYDLGVWVVFRWGFSDLPALSVVVVVVSVKGSSAFVGGFPCEGDVSSDFLDSFCVQPG